MRMWMLPPRFLCSKHLLGEHVETHMFLGTIKRKRKLDGYVKNNLLEFGSLTKRHDDLANEMLKRGMRHKTPLTDIQINDYPDSVVMSTVNKFSSFNDLVSRCPICRKKFGEEYISFLRG